MFIPTKVIDSVHQMSLFATLRQVAFVLLAGGLGWACSNSPQQRPSPLYGDSTLIGTTKVVIWYSSPGVKKRKIWNELVPYGEIWRTGANRATWIELSGPLLLNGQMIAAGRYSLFTIPTDTTWTVIFNKEWDQWGAYSYNSSQDALRLQVRPAASDYTERLTFSFPENVLRFEWENRYYDIAMVSPGAAE